MRGKRTLDLRVDSPPDLAIEADVTSSSLDRMAIYAALGVPEVWRLEHQVLTFHVLGSDGTSAEAARSRAFPRVAPPDLINFLAMYGQMDENSIVRQFRAWVRTQLLPPAP